jgi:hypothetical protein
LVLAFNPKNNQKRNAVPPTLSEVNAIGVISEGLICFTATILVAKKKFPNKTANIAFSFSDTIIRILPIKIKHKKTSVKEITEVFNS